jgi:hypothetical protein
MFDRSHVLYSTARRGKGRALPRGSRRRPRPPPPPPPPPPSPRNMLSPRAQSRPASPPPRRRGPTAHTRAHGRGWPADISPSNNSRAAHEKATGRRCFVPSSSSPSAARAGRRPAGRRGRGFLIRDRHRATRAVDNRLSLTRARSHAPDQRAPRSTHDRNNPNPETDAIPIGSPIGRRRLRTGDKLPSRHRTAAVLPSYAHTQPPQ